MRNLKRVLSLALALVMVLGMMVMTTSAATYTDETYTDAAEITYTEAVAVMTGIELFKGKDDGSLGAKEILTREQAATLIARIMLGDLADDLVPTRQIFTDVPTTKWSAAAIEYCYNTGAIAGCGDGTFNPTGELTGTAFAKLLLCAMGYDAGSAGYEGTNWSQNINADALAQGLIIDGVKITEKVTREQAAQMVLLAMDCEMVRYIDSYDYATGEHIVLGPLETGKDFQENYYPTLTKAYNEYYMWGRPYQYVWYYQDEVIYSVAKTPVKTYTTFVTECDLAEDLGLKGDAAITKWTWDNQAEDVTDENDKYIEYINLLATKAGFGRQGTLFEVYSNGKGGYEFVMIDTWLARVTDVTECTYDRNNHLDEMAELYLDIYDSFTDEIGDAYPADPLVADVDWDYKVGEWLLVNYDRTNDEPVIVGAPETLTAAQTAWTNNNYTHEVDDVEYDDAYWFMLDQTGYRETDDHVWFFDSYGNLIGAIDPAKAPDTYGVISAIYWRDSRDGETGYAYAKITYMDGTSEWKVVEKIAGETLEGVEGKTASYANGFVSSTKQYNVDEFVNAALYKISSGKNGLVLTETEFEAAGQLNTNEKTVVEDEIYVNSKTMFLVYNTKSGEYTAYVGVRNLPEYLNDGSTAKNPLIEMWVAEVDRNEDTNAEYVFVIDPATEQEAVKTENVVVLTDDTMKVKATLKNNEIVSYTYSKILVNGETGSVVFKAAETELMAEFEANVNAPMILVIEDGYVVDVLTKKDEFQLTTKPATYFAKTGELGVDCEYEADDETLFFDGEWYDVMDAELIGARNWKAAAGMEIAIVFDADLAVAYVYCY